MQDKSIMYKEYYKILELWMRNLEDGKKIVNYFQYNHYYQIALYGMGKMANHVIKELKGSDIQIAYAIDRTPYKNTDIRIISCDEEEFPLVDAIIVTPTYDFINIERELCKRLDIPVISLDEVIRDTAAL